MPVAPVYGKRGGRPLSYSAWDIADEPSQRSIGRRGAMPGGRMTGSGAGAMSAYAQGPSAPPAGGGGVAGRFPSLAAFGMGGGNAPAWLTGNATPKPPQLFDESDPFKGAPNLMDPIRNIIAEGGRGGVFNPDYLTERMRLRAGRNADAGRERIRTLASLSGLDPMQYRGAMVNADIGANQGMVSAMNDAEMADAQGYRQMILDLLNRERYGVEAPGEASNIGRRFEEEQAGGLGGFLGQTLGGIGASWLSPGGLFQGRGNRARAGG